MPSGNTGHRAGPAPDPNALRRGGGDSDWAVLPSEGRLGDPPEWPLAGFSSREAGLWAREWRRPQAVMWERFGQELEVAMYVRTVVDAEASGAPASIRTLLRQQQEALGLSLPGLARNRWKIEVVEADSAPSVPRAPSIRDRLKVMPGGRASSG